MRDKEIEILKQAKENDYFKDVELINFQEI